MQNNINSVKYICLTQDDNKKGFASICLKLQQLKYPLIVKPVDCNSSKGVKKVENYQELIPAFDDAVKFSRTNTAVVEEFVSGVELSIDVYVEDGTAHVLSVSKLDKIENNE